MSAPNIKDLSEISFKRKNLPPARADVETEEKGKTYLYRERAFSTFRRRIGFGERIDTEKASANMAEGILEIKLPKLEPKPEKKTKKLTPQ